jgi:hypothetical protein
VHHGARRQGAHVRLVLLLRDLLAHADHLLHDLGLLLSLLLALLDGLETTRALLVHLRTRGHTVFNHMAPPQQQQQQQRCTDT